MASERLAAETSVPCRESWFQLSPYCLKSWLKREAENAGGPSIFKRLVGPYLRSSPPVIRALSCYEPVVGFAQVLHARNIDCVASMVMLAEVFHELVDVVKE